MINITESEKQLLTEFEEDLLNGLHIRQHKNKWGKNRDFDLEKRLSTTMEIIRTLCAMQKE